MDLCFFSTEFDELTGNGDEILRMGFILFVTKFISKKIIELYHGVLGFWGFGVLG